MLTFHFLYMQFYSSEKSVLHQYNISHSWYFCSLSKTFYVYVLILLEDVYSLAAWEWKVNCHISYLSQSLWMQSAPNDKKKTTFPLHDEVSLAHNAMNSFEKWSVCSWKGKVFTCAASQVRCSGSGWLLKQATRTHFASQGLLTLFLTTKQRIMNTFSFVKVFITSNVYFKKLKKKYAASCLERRKDAAC